MAYEPMASITGMVTIGDQRPVGVLAPGFRFHPTDEELILHYLKNRVAALPCPASIITELDIYKFNPWDLPGMAVFGEEWYFFTPRDRKYPNGVRPNRAAGSGYWKATGTDKPIVSTGRRESIGVKKVLVFYIGKPPRGTKTGWIMHEYRLAGAHAAAPRPMPSPDYSMRLDDWVLCRIFERRSTISPPDPGAELPPMGLYPSSSSANISQQRMPEVQDYYAMSGDGDLFSMTMVMPAGQNRVGPSPLSMDGSDFVMHQEAGEGCSSSMLHPYNFHASFHGRPFGQ